MIFDAFLFRNELEILEIRLHELAPYVDYFVLVEGSVTFQGKPKPFYFEEVKERFAAFPIIHVKPPGVIFDNPWECEAFQRNHILKGLEDADPDDIALIGDVDEIPRGEKIADAIEFIGSHSPQIGFWQDLCFYHVNVQDTKQKWSGTQAATVSYVEEASPEGIRRQRVASAGLPDAGAHWCNFGDPEWLIEKIESFAHTEVNLPEYKDPDLLAKCIREHREMTGRSDLAFEVRDPEDIWLPEYLRENRERFAHFFAEVGAKA